MLIGIDASRANKDKKTGVEWYSYHLIQKFKKLDNKNQFFLYTNKPLKKELGNCPDNFREKLLKWPIPRSWTVGRLSLEMIKKNKPDLLFVPAHTLPLINPKKSVVTIHDIGFEHFSDAYHWADKLYHRLIIRLIKRSADKIITVSHFSKQDLVKTYNINPEKIKVIWNGYDDEKYRPIEGARQKLKEKYNITDPFVLFVGRIELKKNVPRLVEAFAKYKQKYPDDKHKLVLVGVKGLTFPLVEEKIQKYNIEKDIIFPGWVSDDDLPLFHNSAALFAFPSLFEGFGIPIVEAMSCNCPVICSNTTSLPEVAGDATLMFDPENVDEISSRIEQVLQNETVAESLVVKGEQRCKLFSWKKCAEETLDFLIEQRNT
ncbi:glycosyltransferase family 4 protein [Candidatus Falkowbacteria bacterium]|jgi:glycosyltransferase involved in cell wall biosynthesis|nr:glycosyltransferase family 4 protein [Candidatus Falkowbacteria bacterium]MBT7007038.1 glycosyltransferase family 4 protein [Candidatus Falkowbacteria bacterium]